jgi:hypothetical protein
MSVIKLCKITEVRAKRLSFDLMPKTSYYVNMKCLKVTISGV